MTRNASKNASLAALSRALVLLISLLGFSGCTAMSKYDAGSDPAPFSATANNLGAVYLSTVGYEPERRTSFDFFLSPMAIPVWLGTLPVSAAWDLLTLPYDLFSSDLSDARQAHERRWERIGRLSGSEAADE